MGATRISGRQTVRILPFQFQTRGNQWNVAGSEPAEIGRCAWVIPEGFIPAESHGRRPEMESHETACMLNVGEADARVEIMVFFEDRDPAGPYQVEVPSRRTRHLRFNELTDPEPVPRATDYASLIRSDVPIVVQHTRLDSRQAENALVSTIAYPGHE
jgi:hypothetical protein